MPKCSLRTFVLKFLYLQGAGHTRFHGRDIKDKWYLHSHVRQRKGFTNLQLQGCTPQRRLYTGSATTQME